MNVEARLRAFAAVARQRSFSRAAGELFVSQPAVSKHIASLETEVGRQLVVRGRREATLTPAGELLADYVLRAEALLANASRALAAGEDGASGTLSLAASGIPGTYLLPELLGRFTQELPAIEIDFQLSTSGGALELVRAHRVELGVVGGLVAPPELESEPLVEDEVVLVGPPALARRRLRARELEGLTWISREEGSATRAAVEAGRWELGLHAVRTLELPSWEAVKRAVASGAGIAAISRFGIELELEAGALAVLDVPRWRVTRTIAVVTARDVPLTPPAARFLDLLRTTFAGESELAPNSNLPSATPLVGRVSELQQLVDLLRGPARLVTALGPGGAGKTTLALAAAGRVVDEFRDGVFLVDLTPLRDPALVLPAVARVLGVPDGGSLTERLRGRQMLLVLDNVEQVAAAAPEVAALVAEARSVTVLATSRVALKTRGERVFDVPSLAPDDAVALFVERALAADSSFVDDGAVVELCRRLEGLPLAIELAAARVPAYPPVELVGRLGEALALLVGGRSDAPSRQRTLRGAIGWSEELLPLPSRRVFAALGILAGGCDLDTARAVCRADEAALGLLVDASLLRHESRTDGPRFRMLETIREFAAERLAELGGVDDASLRLAEHLLAVAREAEAHARGPDEPAWLERLELELPNIRVALGWCAERGERALGLELGDALEPLWVRGHRYAEGLRWLDALLALEGDAPPQALAGSLAAAGRCALELGEVERGRALSAQAERVAAEEGDDEHLAWALHGLGDAALRVGDTGEARARFRRSGELFARLGMHGPAGGRESFLAELARAEGDSREAREAYERSVRSYEAAGDAAGVAGSLQGLGDVALDVGDAETALAHYRAALDWLPPAERPFDLLYVLGGFAAVAAITGRPDEAARLWGAVEGLEADLDHAMHAVTRAPYENVLGELDPRLVAAGRRLSAERAVALARAL
jgi:predicted ATPase/DNA-binding transcriptional LysR family regulator